MACCWYVTACFFFFFFFAGGAWTAWSCPAGFLEPRVLVPAGFRPLETTLVLGLPGPLLNDDDEHDDECVTLRRARETALEAEEEADEAEEAGRSTPGMPLVELPREHFRPPRDELPLDIPDDSLVLFCGRWQLEEEEEPLRVWAELCPAEEPGGERGSCPRGGRWEDRFRPHLEGGLGEGDQERERETERDGERSLGRHCGRPSLTGEESLLGKG